MISTSGLIKRKRDGGRLSPVEIQSLIGGYMSGGVPEYQMAAWLMAVYFRGLILDETLALTDALIASGERLDLSSLGRRVVDKHSTGGVGDKVSLVLGPLVAACGAVFGKMSGRSLGHTGGTVDKLESIAGFKTEVEPDHFLSQLRRVGVCIAGQTVNLAPADGRLYALRDVTATIDSNALTAASIMSKKIAAGAQAVVLDVKVGRGAFFKNRGQAHGVAHLMQEIGAARGLKVAPVMTAMDQPLGYAVGNSLEVLEAVETLRGKGPADLVTVVTELAANLLSLSELGWDINKARLEARRMIDGGLALGKFREWIEAQGGDASFIDNPQALEAAPVRHPVRAGSTGYIGELNALAIGEAALALGAGRLRREDRIDHAAGIILGAKIGDFVEQDQELAVIHCRSRAAGEAVAARVLSAFVIDGRQAPPRPLILE